MAVSIGLKIAAYLRVEYFKEERDYFVEFLHVFTSSFPVVKAPGEILLCLPLVLFCGSELQDGVGDVVYLGVAPHEILYDLQPGEYASILWSHHTYSRLILAEVEPSQ